MRPLPNLTLASLLLMSANTTNCNLTGPVEQPASGFSHSVSTFRCGPADGPATGILLARDPIDGLQAPNPYVSIMIQRAAETLAGTKWVVGTNLDDVSAIYVTADGQYLAASSGTVRIDRVVAQERIEGSIALRFPSQIVTERFNAPWIESFMLCG